MSHLCLIQRPVVVIIHPLCPCLSYYLFLFINATFKTIIRRSEYKPRCRKVINKLTEMIWKEAVMA
jgi:hypothetical protein